LTLSHTIENIDKRASATAPENHMDHNMPEAMAA
jgi:hypothetical protein